MWHQGVVIAVLPSSFQRASAIRADAGALSRITTPRLKATVKRPFDCTIRLRTSSCHAPRSACRRPSMARVRDFSGMPAGHPGSSIGISRVRCRDSLAWPDSRRLASPLILPSAVEALHPPLRRPRYDAHPGVFMSSWTTFDQIRCGAARHLPLSFEFADECAGPHLRGRSEMASRCSSASSQEARAQGHNTAIDKPSCSRLHLPHPTPSTALCPAFRVLRSIGAASLARENMA